MLLVLFSMIFGLCSCQEPPITIGGEYSVLGKYFNAETIVFTETEATFTYIDGSSQTFLWCYRNDYESNNAFKVISINELLFGVARAPRGLLRLWPLFGEAEYEYANLYLKKE